MRRRLAIPFLFFCLGLFSPPSLKENSPSREQGHLCPFTKLDKDTALGDILFLLKGILSFLSGAGRHTGRGRALKK